MLKLVTTFTLLIFITFIVSAKEPLTENEWHKVTMQLFKKQPWVRVELKTNKMHEGKIIEVHANYLVLEVNKDKIQMSYEDIVSVEEIRSPEQELEWTIAAVIGIVVILAVAIKAQYN
ncbi:MAG: hypothetical protein ACRD4B_10340 [Acidobacteriota bacterium]